MWCNRNDWRHRQTVEGSGIKGVNAETINLLSKSQSLTALIGLRVCARAGCKTIIVVII